jgi:uncharacterized protein (DUF362 family)
MPAATISGKSRVAVAPLEGTVQETVRRAMELAEWRTFLQQGRPTALKPNLGWDLFIPGAITSPAVIEGVILTIRDWVGPMFLVESDQVLENIEKAFRKCRLQELCDRYGVRWVNMSHEKATRVSVPNGKVFRELEVAPVLLESQIITIPVMKTHAKTQITGAIKNQWGCISKMRHNFHLVLDDALADIHTVVRPAFAVMDATIALEGNGPKSGSPRIVNRILASHDLVALDTIQAKLMGLDPATIRHLAACAERGIGTAAIEEIQVVGEDIAGVNLHFKPASHNLVSRVEELLRRSSLKKLFFDTPLFLVMLFGAKIWYYIWFYCVSGKKHWKRVLDDPFYGEQWRRVAENDRP